jgi:uncharacterized MnhB-related membrane protein
MLFSLFIAAGIITAVQAIRVKRLISSALWLAGTSALLSISFYLLGAPTVAAIELSVGAGLVTVLFVFAINIAEPAFVAAQAIGRWTGNPGCGFAGWVHLTGFTNRHTDGECPGR